MDNTRSRTYSPKDPNVEASQVYNDDWRAVEGEDEDWPSDLIAEVNNSMSTTHVSATRLTDE